MQTWSHLQARSEKGDQVIVPDELTIKQTAYVLNESEWEIRRLIKEGTLKAVNRGKRKTRIYASEIIRYQRTGAIISPYLRHRQFEFNQLSWAYPNSYPKIKRKFWNEPLGLTISGVFFSYKIMVVKTSKSGRRENQHCSHLFWRPMLYQLSYAPTWCLI